MLKVDIVYGNYLSNKIGPSTNLIRLIANKENFRKEGIDFKVLSLDEKPHEKDIQIKETSALTSFIKKIMNNLFSLMKLNHTIFGARLLLYLKYVRHSNSIVQKYAAMNRSADIVVFDEFFTCREYLKQKKGDQKIMLFHHGNGDYFKMFEIYLPGIVNSIYLEKLKRQFGLVLKEINAFIFVSNFGLNNFLSLNNNLSELRAKFQVLYYGVEDIRINQNVKDEAMLKNSKILKLVCVGSVNERKGQFLIVQAFKRLSKEKRELITIEFLGLGTSELTRLKEEVKKAGLERHLIFHGGVNNPESYLERADAFILTSFDEGLPISIIEALGYGLPIFSTRVAGIPETVEGNGILIEPLENEVFELLNRVHHLDLKSMGSKSKQIFAEKFSYPIYIEKYSKLLKSIAE